MGVISDWLLISQGIYILLTTTSSIRLLASTCDAPPSIAAGPRKMIYISTSGG